MKKQLAVRGVGKLATDVGALIEATRGQVAQAANAALTTLYWQIGRRVQHDVLKQRRAEYGAEIIAALGKRLAREHGRGFDEKSLRHMVRFAEQFPDQAIVSALWRQLSWSHFKTLSYLDDPLKKDFYAELCRVERWSTRLLRQKVQGMLYERSALSRKPAALIRKELSALRKTDELTPALVFRDPYVLGFLGLEDTFSEKNLETARSCERFRAFSSSSEPPSLSSSGKSESA